MLEHDLELGNSTLRVVQPRVPFGQPDSRDHVVRGELDDLFLESESVAVTAIPLVAGDDVLELRDRVRCQLELDIEFAEPKVGVGEGRIDVEDLLPDGDGLQEEPVLAVVLSHSGVGRDRLRHGPFFPVQVADLQPNPDILRLLLNDAEVLLDGPIELAFLGVPLRFGDGFVFVDCHPARLTPSR